MLPSKPTNAHTLSELQDDYNATPTCFRPHWPIIRECTVV